MLPLKQFSDEQKRSPYYKDVRFSFYGSILVLLLGILGLTFSLTQFLMQSLDVTVLFISTIFISIGIINLIVINKEICSLQYLDKFE